MKSISSIFWWVFISAVTYMVITDLYTAFTQGIIRKIKITGFVSIEENFMMFIFTILIKVIFLIVLFILTYHKFNFLRKINFKKK
jgi:hypothetical protein